MSQGEFDSFFVSTFCEPSLITDLLLLKLRLLGDPRFGAENEAKLQGSGVELGGGGARLSTTLDTSQRPANTSDATCLRASACESLSLFGARKEEASLAVKTGAIERVHWRYPRELQ